MCCTKGDFNGDTKRMEIYRKSWKYRGDIMGIEAQWNGNIIHILPTKSFWGAV
jgi:hypothetical protein